MIAHLPTSQLIHVRNFLSLTEFLFLKFCLNWIRNTCFKTKMLHLKKRRKYKEIDCIVLLCQYFDSKNFRNLCISALVWLSLLQNIEEKSSFHSNGGA